MDGNDYLREDYQFQRVSCSGHFSKKAQANRAVVVRFLSGAVCLLFNVLMKRISPRSYFLVLQS